MPQFADEFTSEPESPAVRLRRRLQGRIGGIAPGVAGASPSNAAVPRSSLPIWVQDRLRQQEEERRRQGAALPRAPLPRPLPTPRNPSTATLLRDELLLEPRTSEERLRAILDSPVRGTGAGVGRISLPVPTPAAPPRPPHQPLSEEAEEAVFAEASAQEQQAARSDAPSVYRALREEARLFDEALERDVNSSVGSESAFDRARDLLRPDDELAADEELGRPGPPPSATPGLAEPGDGSTTTIDPLDIARWAFGLGISGAEKGIDLGLGTADAGVDFAVEIGRGAAETALDQLEAVPQLTRDVTDAYFDFWVDRIGDAASLAEPFDTGFVNAWVGQAIAGLTDCPDQRVLPPIRHGGRTVTIHERCGDADVFKLTGGRPFTLGSHVFVPRKLDRGGFGEWEERYHAAQYDDVGDLFLLRYLLALAAHGYIENEFEREAKVFAAIQTGTAPPP